MQFKLLTDIGLHPGNDAFSFYYRGLYIFSKTNFPIKDFKETGEITVDPIFSTVSTIISPPIQEAKIPLLTDFQLVENHEASTSYQIPRLSYTERGIRVANQPFLTRSYSTTTIPRTITPLLKPPPNSTYKVKLDYFSSLNSYRI